MLTKQKEKQLGKFLSLVLRHRPEVIGLTLDSHGWTDIEALLVKINESGRSIDRDDLQQIVDNNNKVVESMSIHKQLPLPKIWEKVGHPIQHNKLVPSIDESKVVFPMY